MVRFQSKVNMSSYTIQDGQTLFDIAIEVYGDVASVFWLLDDNREVLASLTAPLVAGLTVQVRDEVGNPRVATYLSDFAPFFSAYSPNVE